MNDTLLEGISNGDGSLGLYWPDDFPANTTTTVSSQNNTPPWLQITNQGMSILSQWLASRGRYPTTQIGGQGVNPLLASSGYGMNYGQPQGQLYPAGGNPSLNVGSAVGSSLGSGLDGVFNWMAANPLLVAGGALGAFLLFREPPRRR